MKCAYASHGDTKHVLLFPEDPHECFEFAALAFDFADRLQTPVFLMTDLDIGMNQRLCEPFQWDEGRQYDRGKAMTAEQLEAGKEFARYKDVDGDGIPWRTLPGTPRPSASAAPGAPARSPTTPGSAPGFPCSTSASCKAPQPSALSSTSPRRCRQSSSHSASGARWS